MEKVVGWIGFVASALALASAFETFSNAPLHWRLLVSGIACLAMLWWIAGLLASWLKPRQQAGYLAPEAKLSPLTFIIALAVLAAVCTIFVVGTRSLLIDRTTFQLHQTKLLTQSDALLVAPYAKIKRVIIGLPAFKNNECGWTETNIGLSVVDINSPNPRLEIDNFEYPQRITIKCRLPQDAIQSVITEPDTVALYRTDEISSWLLWSTIVGAIIWLIAGVRLWFLSA
jgi:hypothetical protein